MGFQMNLGVETEFFVLRDERFGEGGERRVGLGNAQHSAQGHAALASRALCSQVDPLLYRHSGHYHHF